MVWIRHERGSSWRRSLLIAAALMFGGCGKPQLGPSPEAFKAVDALYTAVSLRDAGRLDRCEADLKRFHTDAALPEAAFESLTGIIAEARGGAWEPARTRLRDFMLAQRPQ